MFIYFRNAFRYIFNWVRVTRSLVLRVCFAERCLVFFVLFHLATVLSVLLLFTYFDYPFGIFKLFFKYTCIPNKENGSKQKDGKVINQTSEQNKKMNIMLSIDTEVCLLIIYAALTFKNDDDSYMIKID